MSRILRAAMTQTVNAYGSMPDRVEDLDVLADCLEEIRETNLDHHADLIAHAADQGVQVVGLGELFAGPYFALEQRELWRGLAESATDGPSLRRLQTLAERHNMVIVAPIYEREGERFFNTALFIDANGDLLGHYRKTHIPQGKNDKGVFDERFYYQASEGDTQPSSIAENPYFPVFETAVGRFGAAICFDRHFEGVISTLADGGAEVIFSPAVTFGTKSRTLWDVEFQVDATRHQVFVGGSNRLGAEKPWGQDFFGQSHFVGPNGRCENRSTHPKLVIADLPMGDLTGPDPAGWRLRANRRKQIYG